MKFVKRAIALVLLFAVVQIPCAGFAAENTVLTCADIKSFHPKLMINSYTELVNKINCDEFTKAQYAKIIKKANETAANPMAGNYDANSVIIEFSALAAARIYENNTAYIDTIFEKLAHEDVLKYFTSYEALGSNIALASVATVFDWLYDDLSDEQKKLCLELIEKGLELNRNYVTANSDWADSEHNINTIANSCIIMAAAAVSAELPEISAFYLENCSKNLATHLGQYTDGPAFNEGPHYWIYATAYLAAVGASADSAVMSAESNFFDELIPSDIGEYGFYMCSPTGQTDFNYADSPNGRRTYGMPQMLYFAEKFNNSLYGYAGKKQCEKAAESRFPSDLWSVLMYFPENCSESFDGTTTDKYLKGRAEIISMRSGWDENALFLAAKGGCNNFSHSHLDAGDFTLSAGGERFVTQLGWEDYSKINMFRGILGNENPRYKYFLNSTEGQNTFLINPQNGGFQQSAENTAVVEKFESNSSVAYGIFDLSDVYDDAKSAKRGFKLYKDEKTVILRDEVELRESGSYWWGIYTEAGISLNEDKRTAMLYLNGKRMMVKLITDGEFEIRNAEPLYPGFARLDNSEVKGVKKLAVHLENVVNSACEVMFSYVEASGSFTDVENSEGILKSWNLQKNSYMTFGLEDAAKIMPGYEISDEDRVERNGDLTTYTQINKNSHVIYDLKKVKKVGALSLAFRQGQNKTYRFEIYCSADGVNYNRVKRAKNSRKTYCEEIYGFPPVNARYVKLVYRGCEEAANDRCRLSYISFFENVCQAEAEMQQRTNLAPDKLNVIFSKTVINPSEEIVMVIGAFNCYGINMQRVPDEVTVYSDNTSVAVAEGRKITGAACGTAMITVSAKYGGIVLTKAQRIYVVPENGIKLSVMEDSTVNSTNNTYGKEDTVYAKNSSMEQYKRYGFMKFNTDISSKEKIQSATLWLYAYDENGTENVKLAAYKTSNEWSEDTICNSNKPETEELIGVSGNTLGSEPRWVKIDVTDFVKNSDTSASLALLQEKGKSKTSVVYSRSTQHAPYVEVCYSSLKSDSVTYIEESDGYDVIYAFDSQKLRVSTDKSAVGTLDENMLFKPLQKSWTENGTAEFKAIKNNVYVLYNHNERFDDEHIVTLNVKCESEKQAIIGIKSSESVEKEAVCVAAFYGQNGILMDVKETEIKIGTDGTIKLLYAEIPDSTIILKWFVWENETIAPLAETVIINLGE